ncbi:MAG: tRNA 2-thiouridine(34) synthase MnmA [Thermodesulfobacteriota bacterium]
MVKRKIGIAMSGGVDSTASALLLQKKHRVHGFFMQLAQADLSDQLERVKEIAGLCDIPLQVIDLRAAFEEKVLRYFASAYRKGRTPNPCMICNPEIKFGLFMDAMLERGMERVATGHYANIVEEDGCLLLQQGKDEAKDQSYFLARLSQRQLARVEFPLSNMNKEDVYELVEAHGFSDFRGRESQDVCFLGPESVGSFLEERDQGSTTEGDIVNTEGRILGRHRGIYNYTIGQRRGLGIAAATPLYVLRIDAKNNQIIVGGDDELFQDHVTVKHLLWNCGREPVSEHRYRVRIRYGHRGAAATVSRLDGERYRLDFAEKQRAVTPGQFAVIYDDDLVVGSGEIQ